MHTMQMDTNKTWTVGFMATNEGQTSFLVMFDRMSFAGAARLVNMLNGGAGITDALGLISASTFKAWEACAHG